MSAQKCCVCIACTTQKMALCGKFWLCCLYPRCHVIEGFVGLQTLIGSGWDGLVQDGELVLRLISAKDVSACFVRTCTVESVRLVSPPRYSISTVRTGLFGHICSHALTARATCSLSGAMSRIGLSFGILIHQPFRYLDPGFKIRRFADLKPV